MGRRHAAVTGSGRGSNGGAGGRRHALGPLHHHCGEDGNADYGYEIGQRRGGFVEVGRGFGSDENGLVQKAFVYEDGEMTELLRSLSDSSGWNVLFEAAAINDLGVIVGVGEYQGEVRGFVATPVPEPYALGLPSLAALLLTRRVLRRRVSPGCQPS